MVIRSHVNNLTMPSGITELRPAKNGGHRRRSRTTVVRNAHGTGDTNAG